MNINNYNNEINLNDLTIIFDDNNSYSYIANNSDEFENDNEEETEIDLNPISPEIEMIFDNYDLAKRFLDQYVKSNGFVIIKGRIEKDKTNKSIIIRRSFESTTNHQRCGNGQLILNKLLELQHEEPEWIIKTRLEGPDN
ncbi:hypothetical protein RhiirA4_453529 [Rhizophagus irregularis]|uniref:Uncharacterized protein n=1 Tax=Rhizophagus irregularis TaxID=588596 RepID=A0A2I1G0Q8_9GLOM|nr:hypothetical protein RhiirA4_453529 [Rhizophagus irregularis]